MDVHAWWSEHEAPDSGKKYYYNSLLRQSTWKKPAITVKRPQRTVIRKIPLVGSWQLVQLSSGETFYYNAEKDLSFWSKPEQLTQEEEDYKKKMETLDQQMEDEDEDFEIFLPEEEDVAGEEENDELQPPQKKQKIDHQTEESINADKERNERVEIFKQLLRDIGTNRFSTWDRILPLIVVDPRFKSISDPDERKWIFEAVVKQAAIQDNRQKIEMKRQMLDAFKQRLNQITLTEDTTFESFVSNHFPELSSVSQSSHKLTWGVDYRKLFNDKMKKLFPQTQKQKIKNEDVIVDSEREAELRREEKRMRVEREQQMQKKALERQRQHAAAQIFLTLLAEFVKNSNANYRDSMIRMEDDERFKNLQIPERDRQDLFHKHITQLRESLRGKFSSLLRDNDEYIGLFSQYESLRDQLKRSDNERFESIHDDRERRRAVDDYVKQKRTTAEVQFQNLLKDKDQHTAIFKGIVNAGITRQNDKELFGEEMDKIRQMLQLDKRYQLFDELPERRDILIDRFVDELIDKNKMLKS
jgi:hypothetical protein